jgi:predicted membrane protein
MTNDIFTPGDQKPTLPVGQIVTGAVLVAVGVGWLLSALDVVTIPWRALLAAVLVVVGIALAATASRGAAPGGLIGTGIALTVILAVLSTVSTAFSVPLQGGFGDRSYTPSAASLEAEYHLIAGQLELSLADVDFPVGETRIEAGLTFGKLVIDDIPDDVVVAVEVSAAAGQVRVLDSLWEGVGIDESKAEPGFADAARRLFLDARVGFGQIEVRR